VAQPKTVVYNLTFALSPEIAHSAPPSANSREPANENSPIAWRATAGKKRASEAGLETSRRAIRMRRGQALVAHILA
jgi:hypothetical protein